MTEPQRIASLLASGTELVCALGMGDRLVGRSHECDYPEWVRRLPELSRPTFDITGSSREIDERVRNKIRAGEPLYEVNEQRLLLLTPEVLITQTHCEVCAVSPADLAHGISSTLLRKQVAALEGGSLERILEGFQNVAAVLDRKREGEALIASLRRATDDLVAKTRSLTPVTVVCLEWLDPVFAMGNWGPELVELAGGKDLLGRPQEHSTTTPWQAILDADPEVLVVAPCGFGLERTLPEMHALTGLPGWSSLRAVRDRRVYVADGNRYFNRSGPTVFATAELLAEMLHPESFPPKHEGEIWRHWDG